MQSRDRRRGVAGRVRPLVLAMGAFSAAGHVTIEAAAAGEPAQPACIAIVWPSVQGVEGSAGDAGSALRDLFTSYLAGPSVQVVPLDARVPSQALEEAQQKQCGNVLIATLTRKRGGGGLLGRALGQAAQTAAWHIPLGSSAGSAIARGAAVGSAQALGVITASTRARDELRLEYRVASPGGPDRVAPRTDKGKARADGEDLLTPMVERAAGEIVAAVSSR